MSDADQELYERIQELANLGHFERGSMEYGIALLVSEGGVGVLSSRQRVVYDKKVVPILNISINDEEKLQDALQADWEEEARQAGRPALK